MLIGRTSRLETSVHEGGYMAAPIGFLQVLKRPTSYQTAGIGAPLTLQIEYYSSEDSY